MKSTTTASEVEPEGRLTALLGEVRDIAGKRGLTLRHLVEGFGRTSFLPLLILPALTVVTPLSGIPLLSSACGLTIALVALQMLAGRDHVWLPSILLDREISARRALRAFDRIEPAVSWIDRHSQDRLRVLVRPPSRSLAEAVCVAAGGAMPLLELVPFSSSILGSAVVLIGVGLLAHDGLYVLLATIFLALGFSIPLFLLF